MPGRKAKSQGASDPSRKATKRARESESDDDGNGKAKKGKHGDKGKTLDEGLQSYLDDCVRLVDIMGTEPYHDGANFPVQPIIIYGQPDIGPRVEDYLRDGKVPVYQRNCQGLDAKELSDSYRIARRDTPSILLLTDFEKLDDDMLRSLLQLIKDSFPMKYKVLIMATTEHLELITEDTSDWVGIKIVEGAGGSSSPSTKN